MSYKNGFFEESNMTDSLNGKKYKDLSNNLKHLLDDIYGLGNIRKKDTIYCKKIEGYYKADIAITVNGITHYLSMKTGKADVIHEEQIKSFILFLRSLGISKETQKTILLYQYGDGTMDGTGKNRMSYEDIRYLLRDRIKQANIELNSNKDIMKKVMEHCMFIGVIEKPVVADCVYHGTVEYGIVATDKQIIKHIERKNWNYYSNLHIGPIMLRPHARYVNKETTCEKRRHKIVCYYPRLAEDLSYIATRY